MEKVLHIEDVSVSALKERYGTPLYIYDENRLRRQCQLYRESFKDDFFETKILYASKAFSCKAMLELIKEEELCADVVSLGEIFTALKAGLTGDRIFFHGNNKTDEEMRYALTMGVKTFFVDNYMEAKKLVEMTKTMQQSVHVLLRINPCIEAHTHEYIQTANIDSKFGISIYKEEEILKTIDLLQTSSYIDFDGFHAHIGSQIFEKEAFVKEIETMFTFVKSLEDKGIECRALDFGGGFAVHYTMEDRPIPIDEISKTILETSKDMQKKLQTNVQTLMIEPGRSIVAEAGSTLYTIGFSKKTPHKEYLFVDGGMTDNIRPCLYQAKYDADVATKMDRPKDREVCVAGKCCESGDVLIDKIKLQDYTQGDLLIVYSTGAYGFSMFNNYNRNLRPAVVFVDHGRSRLVVKRETLEDLLKGDV